MNNTFLLTLSIIVFCFYNAMAVLFLCAVLSNNTGKGARVSFTGIGLWMISLAYIINHLISR